MSSNTSKFPMTPGTPHVCERGVCMYVDVPCKCWADRKFNKLKKTILQISPDLFIRIVNNKRAKMLTYD